MATHFLKDNRLNGCTRKDFEDLTSNAAFKALKGKTLEDLAKDDPGILFYPKEIKDSPDLTSQNGETDERRIVWVDKQLEKYYTGNLMGFFGKNGDLLVIGSRFAGGQENDFFLYHMLNKVLRFNLTNLKPRSGEGGSAYVRLLECMLPHYLKEAVRHGIYKEYVRREHNDSHVRGVIDIPRFIRLDEPFVGKVAYNTREFSYDNPVTQLVRHTIEHVTRDGVFSELMKGQDIQKQVNAIREATPTYRASDRNKVIMTNERNPVRSRYFSDYLALQHLCIGILRGRGVSMRGNDDEVHGVLFDGAWLWEEYLNRLFEERESGWRLYHPRNKTKELEQKLFVESDGGKRVRACYPDYIWKKGDEFVIMDAKYKPIDNISGDDYFQLLAYMYRFESHGGAFLYPREANAKEPVHDGVLHVLSGVDADGRKASKNENRKDVVRKIGLGIPTTPDPDAFQKEMKEAEDAFWRTASELLR